MTAFFETDEGWINSAMVEELRYTADDRHVEAKMRGGGARRLLHSDIDDAAEMTLPTVKADPGYFLLTFWTHGAEDGSAFITRQPIVAWRVGRHEAKPITPESRRGVHAPSAVLYPDGSVHTPGGDAYVDEAEWKAELKAEKVLAAG